MSGREMMERSLYDICEKCNSRIVRDLLMQSTETGKSYWLGVCDCRSRRWQWHSETGDTPWTLVG